MTTTQTGLKSEIEAAFEGFDLAMDPVLDHELGQEEVAAISMGLALRLIQLLLGREAEVDCTQVATSLCRELVALRGNTRGDIAMTN
jgi:hypothetical protein